MKRLFLLVTFIFTIFGLFSCDIDLDNKNTEEPNISDNNDNNSNNSNKDEDSTTEEVEKITLSFEGYYSALNGELDVNFKTKLHTLTESKHKTRGSYDKAWREDQDFKKTEKYFTRGVCQLSWCVVSGGFEVGEWLYHAGRDHDPRNRVVFRGFHR